MRGFKEFLFRGNVVDLAIAVVIGVAFTAVVTALVKDLITPFITAIIGKPDFSNLTFTIHNSRFLYGDFINALLAFILISAVVYFLIIVPMNRLLSMRRKEPLDPLTRQCPECMSEIPKAASRCAYCTATVAPLA